MTAEKKKVLVVTDKNDKSSLEVISYLKNSNVDVIILSPDSSIGIYDLKKFQKITKESNTIWLRRGNLPISKVDPALLSEYKTLNRYFHFLLESHPKAIGSLVKEYEHNKLIDLEVARDCGLVVPDSTIVISIEMLKSYMQQNLNKEYITKSFCDPVKFKENGNISYYGYTMLVNKDEVNALKNDTFFPSFIQEKIEKSIEIRTFYIKEEMYSMAIFSQEDKTTKLDYRNYNKKRPNRNVPYKLPEMIEKSIIKFMNKIKLNTGSLDFILGKDGIYYFLEVNPIGQFGWVSSNCNYYLEKRISELLLN